jgi:transposase
MEATDGFEAELACALQAVGLPVAWWSTRAKRATKLEAMERLATTDCLDATMLAELAAVLQRRPDAARFLRPVVDAEQQRLVALVVRRRQLLSMLTVERLRLAMAHPAVRGSISAAI